MNKLKQLGKLGGIGVAGYKEKGGGVVIVFNDFKKTIAINLKYN